MIMFYLADSGRLNPEISLVTLRLKQTTRCYNTCVHFANNTHVLFGEASDFKKIINYPIIKKLELLYLDRGHLLKEHEEIRAFLISLCRTESREELANYYTKHWDISVRANTK